jgi:hypothetical protein
MQEAHKEWLANHRSVDIPAIECRRQGFAGLYMPTVKISLAIENEQPSG